MKRLILLILGLAGLFTLAGCGTTDPNALGSIYGWVNYERVTSGDTTGFKGVKPGTKLSVNPTSSTISTTSAPVSGATVIMDNTVVATTNSSGYFKFADVKAGTHHIVITHPEYRDKLYTDVDLRPGENKALSTAHMAQAYNVIVGIGDYKYLDPAPANPQPGVAYDLEAPRTDARNMESALNSTFHSTTKLILDQDATKANIMNALNTAVKTVNNNYEKYGEMDYLFFYFSGHGGTDYYSDFIASTEEDRISDTELRAVFDNLDPSLKPRVVVILDSCDSGNFFDGKSLVPRNIVPKALKNYGITVMSASSEDEEAYDGNEMSEFTQYLVAGLGYDVQGADKDDNHEVTVGELFDYAQHCVTDDTKDTQNPAATIADPDLALIRY